MVSPHALVFDQSRAGKAHLFVRLAEGYHANQLEWEVEPAGALAVSAVSDYRLLVQVLAMEPRQKATIHLKAAGQEIVIPVYLIDGRN